MAEKENGFEEAGLCEAEVKNMPVACFLGRGKIHVHPAASCKDVDGCAYYTIAIYNSIYSVHSTHEKDHILMDVVFFCLFYNGVSPLFRESVARKNLMRQFVFKGRYRPFSAYNLCDL